MGMKIRLKPVSGGESPDTLLLTKMQINRLEKARAAGKGCELQLSQAQFTHNAKYGSGKYSQFFAKVGNYVRDKTLDGAAALGNAAIKAGSKLVGETVKGFTPTSLDAFVDAGVTAGSQWTSSQLQSFLRGLKSTKSGSGLLTQSLGGSGVQPLKIDLEAMLKKGSGVRMQPVKLRRPISMTRPSAPFYIQSLGAAIPGPREGGALYLPGSKRKN